MATNPPVADVSNMVACSQAVPEVAMRRNGQGQSKRSWTILSSHGMVLFHVAAHPETTVREVSDALGITERQVIRILKDLVAGEMLEIRREGRRNSYVVNAEAHFRHPTLSHISLRPVIASVVAEITAREESVTAQETT
jgi:DNA-binding MarR family transcriptional regulator